MNPFNAVPSPRSFMDPPIDYLGSSALPGKPLEEADQLVFRTKRDLDPSSTPAPHDPHAALQSPRELLLRVAREGIGAPFAHDPAFPPEGGDSLFRLPDRERAPENLFGQPLLIIRRREGRQGLRVPCRERPVADLLADRGRQLQDSQGVGDSGSIFPDAPGDVLLRQVEFFLQPRIGGGRLERVQVLTLEVLDQGDLQHFLVRAPPPDYDRYELQASQSRCPPAPLPGYDLELISQRHHDERLNDPLFLDGVSQLPQAPGRKVSARLEARWDEPVDRNLERGSPGNMMLLARQKRREAATKGGLLRQDSVPFLRFKNSRPRAM